MPTFKRESKPLLYRLIRVVMKVAMAVFFQKIELRRGEYVPDVGPVVFVANHPNSIMDAFVMGVVTKRKVNYVGHAGLFRGKLKAWFLRSCGVIPVYRREDAPNKMEQNVSAFEACYQALEKGETIGIFPEGTSDMLRVVKRVKTGAARIVLEAERRNGYQLGVKLIPIGLYFFSRTRFRSKVLVNVGKPIELKRFFEINERDNYEAVRRLTEEIQRRLEQLTVSVSAEELDQFVRDVESIYRDELKQETLAGRKDVSPTEADFIVTKQIADCVGYYFQREPQRVRALQARIQAYKRKLSRLRLRDAMLKEPQGLWPLFWKNLLSLTRVIVGLPLAAYGLVNNLLPYLITEQLAKRFVDERTKILTALLLGGAATFLAFYSAQTALVWHFKGVGWAVLYAMSLPVSGLFTLSYLKETQAEKQRISLALFFLTKRQLLDRIQRERRQLIEELNRIKEEYMYLQGWSPEPKSSNQVAER